MTDRELMQMALDALDIFYEEYGWGKKQQKAHEALSARLAQPEQEPAWIKTRKITYMNFTELQQQPEQVISQEWQPANPDAKLRHYSLVLRDLDKTIEGWCEQPEFYLDGKRIDVTQQKPVAWRKKWEGDEDYTYYWMNRYKGSEPLYTAPPQREWQGLTIEERTDIRRRIQEYTPMDDHKYGEAVQFFTEEALKEKNK